ncbi:MAG TPA: aldo/keto reductase, partial [Geobacter sp.]|nr:aldo/keto reductase [Geobacter sp.]
RKNPRFQEENFNHNLRLVAMVREIASAHDSTPAQVALAWLLRRGSDTVPIPGTKHLRYLEENAQAVGLKLADEVWATLDRAVSSFKVAGERYPEEALRFIDFTE